MTKTTVVSVLALSAALATAGMNLESPLSPKAAFAAEAGKKTVSNALGKQFTDANALVQQKKFKEAIAKLDELKAAPNKTAYETFLMNELYSAAYIGVQDYAKAAAAMDASLDTGQAPENTKQARRKNIVTMYFTAKNYPKFNEESAKFQKDFGTDLDMQSLQVQLLYQQNNFKGAAEAGRALVKAAETKGAPVKEDWLKLVRFSEHEAGNAAGESAALDQLLQKFPSQQYWSDALIMAQRNIKGSTKVQLEIYRLMNQTNTLTKPDDYVSMAQLSLQANVPGEAKKVVDAGIQKKVLGEGNQRDRHLRLQNMANTTTDEANKGLAAAETEAKAAATGDAELHMGEVYWAAGQQDKAVAAIQSGLKKGVKDKDEAQLRLGVAHLAQNKKPQATEAFKAITPNSPWAQLARLWTLASATKQS